MSSCKYLWLLWITTCWGSVACKTIYLELNPPTVEEISFLKKYGYLEEQNWSPSEMDLAYTPESLSDAVKKMQAFAGLPETGTLDADTKSLFKKKRCGVKDIDNSSLRSRRYVLQKAWTKKHITYRVLNGSSTLEQFRIEKLMAAGLEVWAPHGGLTFTRLDDGHADIQVSFAPGDHGDGFPFDGPGRVVAHAFPPPHGAMHFDDDEMWADDPEAADDDVTDFFAVAVHEIGHALGLAHSTEKESVMYPYYQVPIERLHMDDILGMQELYLNEQEKDIEYARVATEDPSRSSVVPRYTVPDTPDSDEGYVPDPCLTNYDTLQVIHGRIYVFEEEWVWVLRERNQIEEGYPRLFHDVFKGLPKHINVIKTIYERQNGNVVIFSHRNYWEFSPTFNFIKRGKLTDYGIPREVPALTTVFLSNYNNKTYLIEEDRFWRFDETTNSMDSGYPKDMSAWRDIPYPVDAAIIWKGDTFFFQGPRFWRFDNEIVRAHEYYPLPAALLWLNCKPDADTSRYVVNERP